ncbi:MAG: hypothetical protein HY040_07165 [Planctomycetes bacterium]|nr:hypothetical protein [Planctomycetota bacterium]
MEFLQKPPQGLVELLPEGMRPFVEGPGWYVILGVVALIIVWILWSVVSRHLPKKTYVRPSENLEEILAQYPEAKPSTGDQQLRVEGVPVRMRLVVVAPTSKDDEINSDAIEKLLDRVLPGLGRICEADRPRVRVWPQQLSYEGFAKHLHRNTIIPEGERQLSRWIVVAGRAKLGSRQIMLGLAMQAIKPNSVGRKTIDAHQWDEMLRIRVRD